MASLYKRATPSQARILRAVEGAVKNASDAHQWNLSPRAARSIAKRAAGTLSAQWADVLAAVAPPSDRPPSQLGYGGEPSVLTHQGPRRRALSSSTGRSPLRRVWKQLSYLIGEAKRTGQAERAAVLIEAIKIVAGKK